MISRQFGPKGGRRQRTQQEGQLHEKKVTNKACSSPSFVEMSPRTASRLLFGRPDGLRTWSFPSDALLTQVTGGEIEFLFRFAKDSLGLFSDGGSIVVRPGAAFAAAGNPDGPVFLVCIRLVKVHPSRLPSPKEKPHVFAKPPSGNPFQSGNVELSTLQFSPMLVSFHGHDCLNFVVTWSWEVRIPFSSSYIDILRTIHFLSQ